MVFQVLVLFVWLVLPQQIYGFQKYAEPLKLARPNSKGVYEFEMTISRKLTMTTYNDNEYGHGTPVDYDPESASWSKRDTNQVVGCYLNYTMNPSTDPGAAHDLEDVLTLDGRHQRVITINGITPGLPIVVPYMSEVLLKVHNKIMLDSITVHVHGIDKHGMWYMDGVAFVQQCPITSTNYFEYRFIADNKGTHWYHGHMQSDRGDGLVGGFVVVDPEDRTVPVDKTGKREVPDKEYSVILQDWGVLSNEQQWEQLNEKSMKWLYGFDNNDKCYQPTRYYDGGSVGGAVPISAILINDKGWHNLEDVMTRPQDLPLERFRIEKGESVLFRIVNGGIAQALMVHILDHNMTVVAADGEEVVPKAIDRLIVFPGERYDILIHGLDQPTKKTYRFQVETLAYYNWDWTIVDTFYGIAFLEYDDNKLEEDKSLPNYLPTDCTPTRPCITLNCPFEAFPSNFNYTCVSYDSLQHPEPEKIDKEILQDTPFTTGYEEHFINMHFDSHVDSYKFEFPRGMPYYHENNMDLIAKPCDESKCPPGAPKYDPECNCFYHLKHKLGNIVQIVLYNMGEGGGYGTGYAHPLHIHGTHFHMMKVGWPKYNASGHIQAMNPDINCAGMKEVCDGSSWSNSSWFNGAVPGMNTVNPTSRDTVTLPVGGYIVLRFRATNPGWWFAHCHLVLHHMGGTAFAFRIGEHDEIEQPPANFPHACGRFEAPEIPAHLSQKTKPKPPPYNDPIAWP